MIEPRSKVAEMLSEIGRHAARHDGRRHRGPAPGPRYYEDPTVAQVAHLEADRIWQRIGRQVQGGTWFYQARERILAEEIPDIAKAYGRPVARRVEQAVQHTNPTQLPGHARAAVRAANACAIEAHLVASRGGVGWLNRVCLRLFGVHFA